MSTDAMPRRPDRSDDLSTSPQGAVDWAIAPREYRRMESRRGRRHAYEHLTPCRTALVVVDMVPFFVDADPRCLTAAVGINQLAKQLRGRGGTVAWVVPRTGEPTEHAVEFYGPDVAALYAGSGGAGDVRDRIWPGFDRHTDDLMVEKSAPSAFFPGRCDLHGLLSAAGIDTVLIAGTVTNVCCESSARDASTLGYRVVMIADLTAGSDVAARSSTFTVVYRTFGDVRTSSEVATLLRHGQSAESAPAS